MRPFFASLAVAAVSLLPVLASAAPATAPTTPSDNTPVQLAQGGPPGGWWEQEDRVDELRQRYWQLPPPQRYRYNQLEAQVRDLQARQEQLRREQRRILRWGY
jgi:Spy/CpxP family protein refolding chaperone